MADLCTTAQVKTRLGIGDATDDAVIGEIVSQVSDEIQTFVGRLGLTPEAGATYVFDTALGHVLDVPRGIRAVTAMSIAFTDQPDAAGAYTAVTLADVMLRPKLVDRRPGWPATQIVLKSGPLDTRIPLRTVANGATVTGDFGFSPTPAAVTRIALDAAVALYLDRKRGGQAGAEGLILPQLLAPGDLAQLRRLRGSSGLGIA